MICEIRKTLLTIHREKVLLYSKAAMALSDNIGICAKEQYQKYYKLSEAAREAAQQAQSELNKHIVEHGCMKIGVGV